MHGILRAADEKGRTVTLAGRRREGRVNPDVTYPLSSNEEIKLSNEPAKLSDLTPGVAVTLHLGVDRKTAIAVSQSRKKERGAK